jgi:hypothetical protein
MYFETYRNNINTRKEMMKLSFNDFGVLGMEPFCKSGCERRKKYEMSEIVMWL